MPPAHYALALLVAWVVTALIAPHALAQTSADFPPGFYAENAASGARFHQPVEIGFAPDGRLFVLEKRGRVYVVEDGVKREEPFLDLGPEVYDLYDRGMLGLALDPRFGETPHVYLAYTVSEEGDETEDRRDVFARVTRYTASAGDPNRADLASRRVLIGQAFGTGIPACFSSHSIGTLAFGADGTLFVGAGDAASYTEADVGGLYPECFGEGRFGPDEDIGAYRAQSVNSLAGKILRVDPETGQGLPSNPWWDGDADSRASRVWAMGLRNPFRFTVDRTGGSPDPADGAPGTLYIGDVGWNHWEEINRSRGGENFGWPCLEANAIPSAYREAPDLPVDCEAIDADPPEAYWNHGTASASYPQGLLGRSITVGDAYEGALYPEAYQGRLFYGDFSLGWTASAAVSPGGLSQHEPFALDVGPAVSFRYDSASESMHWVDVWRGEVFRLGYITPGTNTPPVALAEAAPPSGEGYLTVSFDASGSFDPDGHALSYAWAFGDGEVGSGLAPSHTYPEQGAYPVSLVVRDAVGDSSRYDLSVRVGSAPPTITSVSPPSGTVARMGTAVLLSAAAADPEGEALTYRWEVRQIHDVHEHPDVFRASGPEATFVLPEHGIPGQYVGYHVRLTVRDPAGMEASASTVLHADPPHDLPRGWDTRPIGGHPRGGAARYREGFRIFGGGPSPDRTRDYVRFAYQTLVGDGYFEARLDELVGPERAAAGIMVRAGLHADAAHAFALWEGGGASFQKREAEGEEYTAMACPDAPSASRWLRLERRGATLDMLTSSDGESWTPCTSATLASADTLFAGLAVSSQDSSAVATATFSAVSGILEFPPEALPSSTLGILRAFPNPTATRLSLRLAWPTPEPARLIIVDVLGRSVRSFQTTPLEAGEETVEVDLSGLPAGPYVVRVVQGGQAVHAKISVL